MSAITGGLHVGRYRVISLLGRGGMGEVYLAHDETLDRRVAIKFVNVDLLGDPQARGRVLKEARAAAGLDHPSICTVYETGETPDGLAYIVMAYVEGETLAAVLQRGALSVHDALTSAAHIADALAMAHHHGIIHRDLKPGNVVMTPAGVPKLLDFGIAKVPAIAAGSPDAPTESTAGATGAGALVGTPAYMSPEQVRSQPVDGRSDLFALGALLHECLTGRRAFQGATPVETAANVLHVHPPAPSTLRPDLTESHDELCRRLLAKDAADRFQSAQEVVGAIRLLLHDTSRTLGHGPVTPSPAPAAVPPRTLTRRSVIWLAAFAALTAVALLLVWNRRAALPTVPADADVWYRRGTDALREGAYQSARRAFDQAVAVFPQHALAYARRAEADAELDDPTAARDGLLRVAQLVPDESRLPEADRLRLRAVRSLVLRDVDAAVATYRELVRLHPTDAGAWLDLGRAQEAAGSRVDARDSYRRAIEHGRQYASGYLRLGVVEGQESNREAALAAFAESERLYRESSDVEGEAEALFRRGAMFDTFGDLKEARAELDRALSLATDAKLTYQRVRIQLSLSSVIASEGRLGDAERLASAAVQEALANGMDTVAADGLTSLGATLLQADRAAEAQAQVERAIQLAEQRGARRTGARARVQLGSIFQRSGRPAEALRVLDEALPFLKANRYRRFELIALSIASRAHQQLDALDRARQISSDVLQVAEVVKDQGQIALAASNLASVTMDLGDYPRALQLRQRAEAIHRQQGDNSSLPYDLANRADLLIGLGRREEADALLDELEKGIAAGVESFVGRKRRAIFLRAVSAATALECDDALQFVERIPQGPPRDAVSLIGAGIADFCHARRQRRGPVASPPDNMERSLARERLYWSAAASLERGDGAGALEQAQRGLALVSEMSNDEIRWRLAAVAAVAARSAGDTSGAARLTATALRAFEALRSQWQADFGSYERRPDIAGLRRRVGG